jgi:hypothetical protein
MTPLEALIESTVEPDLGSAGLHATTRAGRRLVRMLRARGLATAVEPLRAAFRPPGDPTRPDVGAAGRAAAELLTHWGIDGTRVARSRPEDVRAVVADRLDATALAEFDRVLAEWRAWYGRTASATDGSSWDDERLEYTFSLGAATPDGEVVLVADEHTGGPLDWYSCDISVDPADTHGLAPAPMAPVRFTGIPTPIRYTGQPAARWWAFEDSGVNFGAIEAGPADLARLIVAGYAIEYGDDWFLVPLRLPLGSLTELVEVEVLDTFGGRTTVASTARLDEQRYGPDRAWRLFELAGDEVGPDHPAPWLFTAPTVATSVHGPALEQVAFVRDEAANLAWGIERGIEGPLGRRVDRADVWHRSVPDGAGPPDERPAPDRVPPTDETTPWRYRLGGEAPPWWIPLVAERFDPARPEQVRLRRARLQTWEVLDPSLAGPRSDLLDPRRPRFIAEEEVPSGGVVVERSWQLARWHDGSVWLWQQRRKRPGHGDRGSGLRWDALNR